ncbi:MAG: transketolase [Acidobacteria bacterium]|nr:transketolase [Acidobacteriota bacterium]MCB9396356.1 transketolase [Acidobacteriota bacterium]
MNSFARRCQAVRHDIVDMAESAKRGHIPSALSLVEILVSLYDYHLHFDANQPLDPDRDRLILSKGHGCMALYALLADKGFFPKAWCQAFCAFEGMLGGHPEERVPGVEATTGSLGHGLAIGIGMALAGRMQKRNFHTYIILGDGECTEGSVWESALAASKHKLDNLTVLVDFNGWMSFGPTQEVGNLEPFEHKWNAFGFATQTVDLNKEPEALVSALNVKVPGKPRCFICKTIKGKGIDFMEGNLDWHHKSKLDADEIAAMRQSLKRSEGHA